VGVALRLVVLFVSSLRNLFCLGVFALFFLPTAPNANAAPKPLSGRELFVQQCSKCHGRNGEGVKGKYEGPIQGDRSLDKLKRYIQRNMPDDDPGKLLEEQSAAVAQYVFDTLYTREGRQRSAKAARVELVRLTNR